MLGGMMPIAHTVTMLRSSSPQAAVGLLASMPADRVHAVLQSLHPQDVARLLPAMRPHQRGPLIAALTSEQIAVSLLLLSAEQAGKWLSELSEADRLPIMGAMPPQAIPVLLRTMPGQNSDEVLASMGAPQAHATRESIYERGVVEAFGRTNVTVTFPDGAPSTLFLVEVFGQTIAVTALFHESGVLTPQGVQYGQNLALDWQAAGVLIVTNMPVSDEAIAYSREARRQGWLLDTVMWIDRRHDGAVQRALVGLIR